VARNDGRGFNAFGAAQPVEALLNFNYHEVAALPPDEDWSGTPAHSLGTNGGSSGFASRGLRMGRRDMANRLDTL
jgi:hypothetical protein